MNSKLIKATFDEMKSGYHISIGHPLWNEIVEHSEELIEYFSHLQLELEIKSDIGYCYFKTADSNDLIDLKRARRAVAILNILVLEIKNLAGDEELEGFLLGRNTFPLESLELHNTGRFSKALKQLGISDKEEVIAHLKSSQSFGFHKIENGRIMLQKASDRIFKYTLLEIPKVAVMEEEE